METMSETTASPPDTAAAVRPVGSYNANPQGLSFLGLIAEDFAVHGRSLIVPGFWAIAVHRFGNWRKDIRPRLLELPFSVLYRCMYIGVNWMWGIDLSYAVVLGRRVRIWHHGCILIGARSLGDDVHIRQSTTMGLLNRGDDDSARPIIESRVDIGAGACILGAVTIGHDSVIGPNTVVLKDVAPHSTMFGIPARPVRLLRPESSKDPA
jgi:serine O-acetyltransferase